MNKITIMDREFGREEVLKKELFLKYEEILKNTLKAIKEENEDEREKTIMELLKAALGDGYSYGFHEAYILLKNK